MKKKGFTLIELLAIIVILAIIALIAVPVVLNIIDRAKKSSVLRRGEFYADAVQKSVMTEVLSAGSPVYFNECALSSDKKLNCDGKEIAVDLGGDLPGEGSVVYFKDGKVDRAILYYDDNIVIKNSDSKFYLGDINEISGTHVALLESQIKEAYGLDIKIGDYVEYDETKGGTVTVGKDVDWRVLGIENGKLLLMSATSIGKAYLEGNEDYVQSLNNFCQSYSSGEHVVQGSARSISVDDINKITGYNPYRVLKNGEYGTYHKGRMTEYGMEVTYNLVENASGDNVVAYNSKNVNAVTNFKDFVHVDGTKLALADNAEQNEKEEIKVVGSYYWYRAEVLTSLDPNEEEDVEAYNNAPKVGLKSDSAAYDMLFTNTNRLDTTYWVAGNYSFNVNSSSYGVQYGTFAVDTYRLLGFWMWTSNLVSEKRDLNVRAVVTLDSDVTLTKSGENVWSIE